jgi:hypothetical protein
LFVLCDRANDEDALRLWPFEDHSGARLKTTARMTMQKVTMTMLQHEEDGDPATPHRHHALSWCEEGDGVVRGLKITLKTKIKRVQG